MSVHITHVVPGCPAFKAGIKAGEQLLTLNSLPVADILDYQYRSYAARVTLELLGSSGLRKVLVRKQEGQDLGLEFDSFLMDEPKTCRNRCVFCFIDQLPPGLRESLYVKDDDARLSLLTGTYITLTNLDTADIDRLCTMRISPLCLSVHTTDPDLRVRMLGNPRAAEILTHMRRFAVCGITMNCQIVLCPGYNDGKALEQTLADLLSLTPAVASVAVVPVGLTCHRAGLAPLRDVTRCDALAALAIIHHANTVHGEPLVLASDELYLRAGQTPPEPDDDDYPQLENGVGMISLFISQWRAALTITPPTRTPAPFLIATGLAAETFMRDLLAMRADLWDNGEVIGVPNTFFGSGVDVSGLLTGQDLLTALREVTNGRRILLPANMLRYEGDVFLDDMTPAQLSEALGVPVIVVPVDGAALMDAIYGL